MRKSRIGQIVSFATSGVRQMPYAKRLQMRVATSVLLVHRTKENPVLMRANSSSVIAIGRY